MIDRQELLNGTRMGLLSSAALSIMLLVGFSSSQAQTIGGRGGLAGTDGGPGFTSGVADGAGGAGGVQPGSNGGNGGSGISGGGGGGGQYGNGAMGTTLLNNPGGGTLIGGNGGTGGPGNGLSGNPGGTSPAAGGGRDGGGAGSFNGTGQVGLGIGANGGGGAGGAGALVTGSGTSINGGFIQGGVGGIGGSGGALSGNGGGGGGGGSGLYFFSSSHTLINTGSILGGGGGKGGNGGDSAAVGGGGGAGGYGIFGTVGAITNSGNIQGGAGGAGGVAQFGIIGSGSGGDGGDGINGSFENIVNNVGATIAGGDGGAGGNAAFPAGAGGRGIFGISLSIVTAGAINGGLGGNGVTRANAITFFGGTNRLELQDGWSFLGNISATGTNTLALGGAADSSFLASNIGSQFTGFQNFEKTGSSTWQLSGSTTALTPWSILGGTLEISSDEALGDPSGALTIANGATLATTASFSSARMVTLNTGGGAFDVAPGSTFTLGGAIGGVGALTKTHSGTLILTGTSNDWSGATNVEGGTMQAGAINSFSPNSAINVAPAGTINLDGFNQEVSGLSNSGVVNMGTGMTRATVLTVTDNYVGGDGTVIFNTILGGDDSATDKLVVNGSTFGATNVVVTNRGGAGAPTTEGIEIISVGGISDGMFTLLGDYTTQDQKAAVVAGAYAYTLEHNGVSTPTDGNWYLRSQIITREVPEEPGNPDEPGEPGQPVTEEPTVPRYSAAAPVYEAYPQVLLGLNGLPTLQQRVGNRYWNGGGNRVVSEGVDAISPIAPPEEAGAFIEKNGIWGRVEGSHTKTDPRFSTSSAQYELDSLKLQAGVDGMLHESENGRLIGGFTVHYVRGSADISSPFDADNGGGRIRTDGYGLGGTLTWYGDNGFYIDAQGQATWYDSDLSFGGGDNSLVEGNDGFGYALSVEAGKRFMLNESWSVTPQAQLVYSSVDFDNFNDVFDTRVSLGHGDSLQGRLGVTLDHESSWYNSRGMIDRTHVYGIANLYNEFLDGTKVNVSGTNFTSRNERLWGGIGLGGSYNWNNDKYSVYGEGSINTSLSSFGDSYAYKGTLGFRVSF